MDLEKIKENIRKDHPGLTNGQVEKIVEEAAEKVEKESL